MGKISIIVAHDLKGGIGRFNHLPWYIPQDMRHFKNTTQGSIVVMGRKTYESIGSKPLPNRENVVLSRTLDAEQPPHVYVERDYKEVIEILRNTLGTSYVMGGEQIYKLFLPYTDELVMTTVMDDYNCDTFFPEVDGREWEIVQYKKGKGRVEHSYKTFRRKR